MAADDPKVNPTYTGEVFVHSYPIGKLEGVSKHFGGETFTWTFDASQFTTSPLAPVSLSRRERLRRWRDRRRAALALWIAPWLIDDEDGW